MRRLLGYVRYDTAEAREAINDLYRHELRLWLNLYLPSVKLVRKVRKGSKLRRVYDAAQTPLQRALASEIADKTAVDALQPLLDRLDPFALDEAINRKLQGIYALANRRWSPSAKSQSPSIGRQPGPRTDL